MDLIPSCYPRSQFSALQSLTSLAPPQNPSSAQMPLPGWAPSPIPFPLPSPGKTARGSKGRPGRRGRRHRDSRQCTWLLRFHAPSNSWDQMREPGAPLKPPHSCLCPPAPSPYLVPGHHSEPQGLWREGGQGWSWSWASVAALGGSPDLCRPHPGPLCPSTALCRKYAPRRDWKSERPF